jgi:hypothetical protein
MEVFFNNYSKAKHERVYPILNIDSEVRVLIKKTNKTKATDNKWTKETYKIIGKQGTEYLINNNQKKVYLRNELLKV